MTHLYVDVSALSHAIANRQENADQAGSSVGPVNVAVGVASMMGNFIRYYNITRSYFCLDHPTGNWRKHFMPSYKEGRKEKLDERGKAIYQMATEAATTIFPELVELLAVPLFQIPYVEADDLVAACCVVNDQSPGVVVTTDKDFWQLASPIIKIINPIHNYRVEVGPDGNLQKIKADGTIEPVRLTPDQYLLFRAIQGDKSDNLPGLYGIGEVKATDAIHRGAIPALLTENTKTVQPRASKGDPNPQPYYQDAREVVQTNLRFMALKRNEVSGKVQEAVRKIQSESIRSQMNNFTRICLWLESHGISNQDIAKQLVSTYTHQWLR